MSNIVDIKLALEQAGGSEELARDLFSMLLDDLPNLKNSLNQAFEQNDSQALWDHTHKIYGSTAYCGVPMLHDSAKAMEQGIKQADSAALQPLLDKLNDAIQALQIEGPQILEQDWK